MAETMSATVHWRGSACFEGKSGSGHTLRMDGPPAHGGENQGPRPMETLLLGVGGCAAFDIVHILRRSRQEVSACELRIEAERAAVEPAVFTSLRMHFLVRGKALREDRVARAVELSATRHCSASIMLAAAGVAISHSYEVVAE